jgi:AcrR family transcriptional regulator
METRNRILESATKLFAQKGYAGTSVREIALEAQVAKPTIYYYFESKENLYAQLLMEELSKLMDSIQRALKGKSAQEKLEKFAQAYLSYFFSQEDVIKVIFRELFGLIEAEREKLVSRYFRNILSQISKVLVEGVKKGFFRELDVDQVALSILGILNIYVMRSLLEKKGYEVEEVISCLRKTILPSIKA